MRPAAPPRKAFAATAAFQAALTAIRGTIRLRLCAGDEGGQAIDAAGVGNDGLRLVQRQRLRLILRLRTMVAFAMFAGLLVVALIGLLAVTRLMITLVIALAVAVAHEGLLLLRRLRDEARLLAEIGEVLAVILAVVTAGVDGLVAARLLLVLAELLLGGRDQAEIVLGVLVVVLGRDRVTGRARVTRQLNVFFGDV